MLHDTPSDARTFPDPGNRAFRALLETLPAAAYTCDAEGLITSYNRPAVELWGREPRLNDPTDRYCGSFRLFWADGRPMAHAECWMALALRDARGYNGEEVVIERQDGSRFTALAHANPVRDDGGAVVGAVNILVDITDRKRAETLLRQADVAKNEFLAVLAHELRNPLAPMRSALDIMRIADGDAERTGHARATLERQLTHLARIVDDLLEVAHITRDTLELRRETIDLGTVLEQSIETTRPIIDAAGLTFEVGRPNEALPLDGDPQRLAQVFTNLLTNAAKYTDPGGRVRLSVERQGSDAVVRVTDSGIGLPDGAASRIFDMFYRADESVRRDEAGLGIGLTLAHRVVQLHGGSIDATSAGPGRGTEFSVHLPLLSPSSARQATRSGSVAGPGAAAAPRRILIVDDNADAAEALAELLALSGHETHLAADGPDAIARAAELRPDAVLLDIGLPGLNGYEVARQIRVSQGGDEVLLVAITGWGWEDDRRKSTSAGFDEHLVKPVDLDRLSAVLARGRATEDDAPA